MSAFDIDTSVSLKWLLADSSKFQQFFDRYERTVLSIIYRTLGKLNDNEDIAQ
jgi:DNA-directed RNA polymerase specialized sigma24 family protein